MYINPVNNIFNFTSLAPNPKPFPIPPNTHTHPHHFLLHKLSTLYEQCNKQLNNSNYIQSHNYQLTIKTKIYAKTDLDFIVFQSVLPM